jgi:putative membrane-bound dehydrogenase-like protein
MVSHEAGGMGFTILRITAIGVFCCGIAARLANVCIAADSAAPDEGLAAELPRVEPLEPADALGAFRVAPGYRIELAAAEPLVTDPVAMAFDEQGRLFVVEMRGYSEQGDLGLGRIRILEDVDQDGRFDKSTVFADKLSWPTAVACSRGGIVVGAAPELFFLQDQDGDLRADQQTSLLSGFGRTNVQGLLNSLQWGLDNRIHGATSSSGGEVRQLLHPDRPPLALRGRDFALDPLTWSLEAVSGGGQHGLSFSRWGDKFVCHNSDHLQMIVTEDRYLSRNPYQAAGGARRSIAADGPQAEVFRASHVEPWRIVRTRMRIEGKAPGPVEGGGRAAGYFTSASGITVYEGDAWPERDRGLILVADVGSNLIHRKRLRQEGARYVAERIDAETEFLTSADIWFRPVQMANGPDGALYVADMYREVIEHPQSLPPTIKRHLDLTSGSDRGRIYRIVPAGFVQPRLPDLGQASTSELVGWLDGRNAWHRRTAARLLVERQDTSAAAALRLQSVEGKLPEGRIASLYAASGLGLLEPEWLLAALEDEHPQVRRHAVLLSERLLPESPQLRGAISQLAAESDPLVARQLAFTLGEVRDRQRLCDLVAIARHFVGDREVLAAVQTSLSEGCGEVVEQLIADRAFRESLAGRQFLEDLLGQIATEQRSEDVAAVLRVARGEGTDPERLEFLFGGLGNDRDGRLFLRLTSDEDGIGAEGFARLLGRAQSDAVSAELTLERRVAAIRVLRWGAEGELVDLAEVLLAPSQPLAVQRVYLESLQQCSQDEVAERLLAHWGTMTPTLREQAEGLLFSRRNWALAALGILQKDPQALAEFGAYRLERWASHSDPGVRDLARQLQPAASPRTMEQMLDDYRSVLSTPGDAARGKAVFRRHCAACHQHEGIGDPVGPNLSSARQRGPEATLFNIVAPNSEIDPRYATYVLTTDEGRVFSGIVTSETEASITLKRGSEISATILRSQIEQMENTGKSLMPEGLAAEVGSQELADLLAFLCRSNEF